IENALTPQEIRDKLNDVNLDFTKSLISYLEDCHTGEFIDSDLDNVKEYLNEIEQDSTYVKPTRTFPECPPNCICEDCEVSNDCICWWERFNNTVNDLLVRCNVHKCWPHFCLNNKWQSCKSRFPRDCIAKTNIDSSGHIFFRHMEEYLNTFHCILTYLMRCNTDVTCMQSGTGIKAVLMYVADYITKNPLKLYAIFDILAESQDKHSTMLSSNMERQDKARSLITKIVNSMTTHMQIRSPVAAAYLLGLPDHYSSHKFKCVYTGNHIYHIS
ncbi:hypothetical protein M422DRAFT_174377, partial [Sphaerobolus stellatus SS14]